MEDVAAVIAADNLPRIGVEQQLGWVEAMSLLRRPRPVDPPSVHQARPCSRQGGMPDAVGAVVQTEPLLLVQALAVEEAKVDRGGMGRCEVWRYDALSMICLWSFLMLQPFFTKSRAR